MLPIGNPAMASKYASQMVNKMAGEAKRLAPWGAPAAIFGACCVPCLDWIGCGPCGNHLRLGLLANADDQTDESRQQVARYE